MCRLLLSLRRSSRCRYSGRDPRAPTPETDALGMLDFIPRIAGRGHRVVRRQAPPGAVLVRRHVVVRAEIPLQHAQPFAVFEADDVVVADRFLDRYGWLRADRRRGFDFCGLRIGTGVNIPLTILQPPAVAKLLESIRRAGIDPALFTIEVTESATMTNPEHTQRLLHSLRTLGVRIALDDFGTGYSSLSYLQSFPFDKLKIDRSFIQNLLTRDGATAIVRAITELAHALNIETTAEGV